MQLDEQTETQIGPWPRMPFTGRRQRTGAGRIGASPTERASPLGYFFGHRRPPKRPPDGGYSRNGDRGVTHGDPEISVQTRDEPLGDSGNQRKMVIDLEFSWQEVDNGEISGLMGGGGTKIGPFEISGISGGREASPGHAAGGKLQEILAGKEGARVCGTEGSVKSGGNILPNLLPLHLRLLLREMRELWEERARVALGYYAIFFFPMDLDIEE
jgi:hypothetical protein